MQDTYTVRQVLEITRNQLGEIEVPVKYKVIADGIHNAVENLNALLDAIMRAEIKAKETQEVQHENAVDKGEGV